MKNPPRSTCNETYNFNLEVNTKLIIVKSYKVKSLIKSIKKYTPKVIVD